MWGKLSVALAVWTFLLVAGNLTWGALTITDPGTGKQIAIHTMYSYRGSGASFGNPPTAVEVRLYKSAAMSEEKGYGATYPGSDGSWKAGAEYTGEVSQAGYVLAEQGAASDDEYVEWVN
jgi:hypothetical protein